MDKIKRFFFRPWFPFLGIVTAGFVLYLKALFFGLTYLDDNVWLLDYQWFFRDFSNSLQFFTRPDFISGIFYRPVLNFSFMLNAQLGGYAPFGYHFVNILIHISSACLLFVFFRKLSYEKKPAFIFSLIFTVHPALTQAVAWIPGRTDSLLGFFILASFICFLDFLEKKRAWPQILHLFFFILALLTKETAVVLPVACFVYLFFVATGSDRVSSEKRRGMVICWIVVTGLWFFIRGIVLAESQKAGFFIAVKSVFQNSPAIVSYIGKALLPFNLSVMPVLKDTTMVYGFVSIILLAAGLWFSKNKRINYVIFGACWFLLFLLPSLVISFLKHEYRLYVPMAGLMIVLMEIDVFAGTGLKAVRIKKKNANAFFGLITSSIVILFFAITFQYSDKFKDRMIFWSSAVETSPHSPLAHRNMGAMYHLDGMLDKAAAEYKKALELDSHEAMAHNNLGLIYVEKNMFEKAGKEYKLEIAINPDYDNVYFNFGLLRYRQGKFKEAEALWKKTLELNPKYIEAYRNLAIYYFNRQDLKSAGYYVEQMRRRGVRIPPGFIRALNRK